MHEIYEKLIKFQKERDWKKFHTPENLAKSISIEAAELLEHFQWQKEYDEGEVAEELADGECKKFCGNVQIILNILPIYNH